MRKLIIIIFLVFMLCGCSAPEERGTTSALAPAPKAKAEIKETIPPFEKEGREVLPLPEKMGFSDSMMFADSFMANYEMLHFTEFETDYELRDMQLEKSDDGYIITSQKAKNETMTSDIGFSKPLDEFFDTPDNSYGVLIRFRTGNADELMFSFNSRFGRIMLDFADGIYPAVDLAGDIYGDPMLSGDWNNYFYTSGEWAYVFMTITNVGQKNCCIWAESNPDDYNFHTSYGEDGGGENSYRFSFEVYSKGESVTISDIWLFSYGEAKR